MQKCVFFTDLQIRTLLPLLQFCSNLVPNHGIYVPRSLATVSMSYKKVIYDHDDIMQGDLQRSLYYVILDIKALGLILLLATATK